ncbi:HNH endonuclease [Paraburkholderia sp. SIMBA_027]|uniref:HNH endonuclease n=1 Tax=Paraburkholderia sp. SIMBA_027 TaxID=3085770 RepID=UPI00397A1845
MNDLASVCVSTITQRAEAQQKEFAHQLAYLTERYEYNPDTGEFISRESGNLIKSVQMSYVDSQGVSSRIYITRVIYMMVTGNAIPRGHIVRRLDGDKRNNKWANLYLSTYDQIERAVWVKQSLVPYFEAFHECFEYDAESGALTWKERPAHHFKTEQACKIFNARRVGTRAGTAQGSDRRLQVHMTYRGVKINAYVTHIAWVMMHRSDPPTGYVIDHQDRDNRNDSKSNLRLATYAQNSANATRRTGISGYRGVTVDGTKYIATMSLKERPGVAAVYVRQRFNTKEEAVAFRRELERKYFGEFRAM